MYDSISLNIIDISVSICFLSILLYVMTNCLLFLSRIVRQSVKAKAIVNWWLSTLNKIFASNGRLVTNFQQVFQVDLDLDGQVCLQVQVLPLGVWLVLLVILVTFKWVHTWFFQFISFFLLFLDLFLWGQFFYPFSKIAEISSTAKITRSAQTVENSHSFFNVSYTWCLHIFDFGLRLNGLNIKICLVQKVYEWSNCSFAKMIFQWGDLFGKRTAWSLIHFLNYVYFDI